MSQIIAAATAFAGSYASAIALGSPGDPTSLQKSADAMAAHYAPNLTAFTLGSIQTLATAKEASAGTLVHLQKLVKAGVGCDIVLARCKVNEVSESAAVVFLTWELKGRGGKEGWRWRNVYGFRMMGGMGMGDGEGEEMEKGVSAKGKWEWIVSDNEVTELVKRVPKYFEL